MGESAGAEGGEALAGDGASCQRTAANEAIQLVLLRATVGERVWLQETSGLSTAWKSWVSLARSETFILVIGSTLCSWSCGMYSPKALLLPVLGCSGQKIISIVRIEI